VTPWGPYPGTVLSVHDGDTMTVTMRAASDVGFGVTLAANLTYPIRIYGINAPELSTQAGKDALAYALTLVKPGDSVTVLSHSWDKYAPRVDGSITLPDGRDFAQLMLDSGNAVPMKG
jgi:endonuclease YncB( thermonuclease family)